MSSCTLGPNLVKEGPDKDKLCAGRVIDLLKLGCQGICEELDSGDKGECGPHRHH